MEPSSTSALVRMRRNHAIEHATVHVLSERRPGSGLAGRTDSGGFFLFGSASVQEISSAVEEALRRLDSEPELAVHPHCGTNLVVTALLSASASLAVLWASSADDRARRPWVFLPRLLLAATVSALVSQPLGPVVQRRLSTLPDVRGTSVRRVRSYGGGQLRLHRIELSHRPIDHEVTPGSLSHASA